MKENPLDEEQVVFLLKVFWAITACREVRCLTRSELAKLAGINRSSYVRIEKGECNIRLGDLYAIARALNVDIKEFFP